MNAFPLVEGRRHYFALYVQSDIEADLRGVCMVHDKQHYVHADSGYNFRDVLDVPFQGTKLSSAARAVNTSTTSFHVTVEWSYMEVNLYCKTVDFKMNMRVGENAVGTLYLSATPMYNVRSFLYPNAASQYFNCAPPTFNQYLHHKYD